MTQTEQNGAVRMRDEQVADHFRFDQQEAVISVDDYEAALITAEARGAAEQRLKDAALTRAQHFLRDQAEAEDRLPERDDIKKWQEDQSEFFTATILEIVCEYAAWRDARDAEGQEPVGYIRPDTSEALRRGYGRFIVPKNENGCTEPVYTRPANVAALEEEIAELRAEKANAGWHFLTENVSSDPEVPSCRLSALFQEGDELPRFEQAAKEFGIEIQIVTDYREDCDKELSASILAKLDPCQFLTRDGWSFVDVWENDEGGIIRLFARASLAREERP